MAYKSLKGLTPTQKAVYLAAKILGNMQTTKDIVNFTCFEENIVQKTLKELEGKGFLYLAKLKKKNIILFEDDED